MPEPVGPRPGPGARASGRGLGVQAFASHILVGSLGRFVKLCKIHVAKLGFCKRCNYFLQGLLFVHRFCSDCLQKVGFLLVGRSKRFSAVYARGLALAAATTATTTTATTATTSTTSTTYYYDDDLLVLRRPTFTITTARTHRDVFERFRARWAYLVGKHPPLRRVMGEFR